MKKVSVSSIILISLLMFSCMPEPTYEAESGENIIPKDTLELMIHDIHLADAIITSNMLKADNVAVDSLIYQSIYDKFNYSREDFDQTLLYYAHNRLDTLNLIYDRVIERFYVEKGEIYN
ncbi:MAG: hypothetical protein C0596_07085 [Marinilabiliales bacterium]|nr:MAG: hypothetical protein C0596_07085 [Marinilabiliales bacterium]